MDPLLAAYLALTALLVITPGATTAVVVRNTLAGGVRAGLSAAAGAATANTTHAIVAAIATATLVARLPAALVVLRMAGALYLGWLGAQSLWLVWRHADGGLPAAEGGRDERGWPLARSYREGVVVNVLNPAIASFYLAVVPTFVAPGSPAGWYALLAACHVAMAFACHAIWAVGLDWLGAWFHHPAARRTLQAGTGIALLVLAARVFC